MPAKGQPGPNLGKGKAITWMRDHLTYDGDNCLIWPFFRDPNGYGRAGYNREHYWAHRLMCELVNGPPPTPDHEAAHSCGNGPDGCVHPKHLSWKTRVENQADRYVHKRKPHREVRCKLDYEKAEEIRVLAGTEKTKDIAARFNVSTGTVRQIILGQLWNDDIRKNRRCLTPTEVIEIRNLKGHATRRQIAEMYGIGQGTVGHIFAGRHYTKLAQ